MKTLTSDKSVKNACNYEVFGDSSLRTFTYKRYRYVGKERDAESGLYYYGARYYAAWTCRFISVDPLAPKYAHLTPYNYAGNKPIGDYDIDGMQSTGDTTTPIAAGGGDAAFNDTAKQVAETYGGKEGYTVTIKTHMIDGKFSGQITVTGDGKTLTGNYENGKFTYSGSGSATTLGGGIKTAYNGELRAGYGDRIAQNAKNNLALYDKAQSPSAKQEIVNKAIEMRNAEKIDVRKKLTPDAAEVTKIMENDAAYTPEKLRAKYESKGKTGEALDKEIIKASGRSNGSLKFWNPVFRVGGWALLTYGLYTSTQRIMENPTSAETWGEEIGGTTGGILGSIEGASIALAAAAAVGLVLAGPAVLVVALIGGAIGGWIGGSMGQGAGGRIGHEIDKSFGTPYKLKL